MSPFIIYTLPRSRSTWLSQFLTYGPWRCGHDMAVYMRSMEQVTALFSLPHVGSAETAAAPGYRLLRHFVPGLREVVVRRPVDEVYRALMAVDMRGEFEYPPDPLRRTLAYLDRMLDKIAPTAGLVLDYAQLSTEAGCSAVFEYCLDRPFDRDWWLRWENENVQVDIPSVLRYRKAHEPEIMAFKQACKRDLRRLTREGSLK